jgi:hypothetical protein
LLCCGSCVAVCAPGGGGGDATGVCLCGLLLVCSAALRAPLLHCRTLQCISVCTVAFAAVARSWCRAAAASGAFLAMQQRAPWFPAAPTAALVCRCAPHAAASFNVMYQTAVGDARTPSPHCAVQRDCRRGLSSLLRGGRWTTASSVPCPLLSAIVMTVFTYSSMPPSLSVAMDAVASLPICHCLCTHSRRVAVAGPDLLPCIAQSFVVVVALTAAVRYLLPLWRLLALLASLRSRSRCAAQCSRLQPCHSPGLCRLISTCRDACPFPRLYCSEWHRHRRAMTSSASSTEKARAKLLSGAGDKDGARQFSSLPKHS